MLKVKWADFKNMQGWKEYKGWVDESEPGQLQPSYPRLGKAHGIKSNDWQYICADEC